MNEDYLEMTQEERIALETKFAVAWELFCADLEVLFVYLNRENDDVKEMFAAIKERQKEIDGMTEIIWPRK